MSKTNDSVLLNRVDAARYLGIEPGTLANWHYKGKYGIPLIKVGTAARYRKSDLDAWLAGRTEIRNNQSASAAEAS